jgi:hypothetical protein
VTVLGHQPFKKKVPFDSPFGKKKFFSKHQGTEGCNVVHARLQQAMVCFAQFSHRFKWKRRFKWIDILPIAYAEKELVISAGPVDYTVASCSKDSLDLAFKVLSVYANSGVSKSSLIVKVKTGRIWDAWVTMSLLPRFNAALISTSDINDAERDVAGEIVSWASQFSDGRDIWIKPKRGQTKSWSDQIRVSHVLRQIHESTPVIGAYVNGSNCIVHVSNNYYSIINSELVQHFPAFDLDDGFFEAKFVDAFPKALEELHDWQDCTDGSVAMPLIGDL